MILFAQDIEALYINIFINLYKSQFFLMFETLIYPLKQSFSRTDVLFNALGLHLLWSFLHLYIYIPPELIKNIFKNNFSSCNLWVKLILTQIY